MRGAQHFVLAIGAALVLAAAVVYHIAEHQQAPQDYLLEQQAAE
jgi:hypothetical protein